MEEKNTNNPIVFERVEFLCDKAVFKGKIYRPENLERCKGIVIFTHGLGYCDRQYKINGEYFAENDYLMMTYNLRGHAGTPGKWTLKNSVEDLIEGINFLTHKYHFINNERICVIGHSTGALITVLASLRDKRIKFGSVVTIVTCLTDSYLHWFRSGFNQEVKDFFKTKGELPRIIEKFMDDPEMINQYRKGEISKEELNVAHRYGLLRSNSWDEFFYEIANSIDLLDVANRIDIPLLLFRGEYDEIMDVHKTNELYEKMSKKVPSKLYVTESKNHFHNDSWELIQSETLRFFDQFCSYKKEELSRTKDILIIDDEELVTRTLKKLLVKNHLADVVAVNSGEDALKKIAELKSEKNKDYDLIIADVRMPGIDGIETVRRIREMIATSKGHQSSVIFMTGYEGKRSQEEAKALGYVDYMFKPFDIEDLLTSVRKNLK